MSLPDQDHPASICRLDLADSTKNTLLRSAVLLIDDLAGKTVDQLADIAGIGIVATVDVWQALAKHGRNLVVPARPGDVPKSPHDFDLALTTDEMITLLQVYRGTNQTGKELWLEVHQVALTALVAADLVEADGNGVPWTTDLGTFIARTCCVYRK